MKTVPPMIWTCAALLSRAGAAPRPIVPADGHAAVGRHSRSVVSFTFDSFPMYSPEGQTLIRASNRTGGKPRATDFSVTDRIGRAGREQS